MAGAAVRTRDRAGSHRLYRASPRPYRMSDPTAMVSVVASPSFTLVPALLREPDEDSIVSLRQVATDWCPLIAVWEQEDPWGLSGLLAVCCDRDGIWFEMEEASFAALRGRPTGSEALPADMFEQHPSRYQPDTTCPVDGMNVAVTVALGALPRER